MDPDQPPFVANGIVTLTTDFGTRDWYVGAMKGRLLCDFPGARLVDISHDIPPGDVAAGALVMALGCASFPPGTVHVGVVDPGVGSARGALVVDRRGEHRFVGPDNGLLHGAAWGTWPTEPGDGLDLAEAWRLDRIPPDWVIAPTFHGRDLFARAAARLAAGASIAELSSGIEPAPVRTGGVWQGTPDREQQGDDDGAAGRVVHVDRFGNLVIGLHEVLGSAVGCSVEIAGVTLRVARTYADVPPGELLAYVGSASYIEVAVRDGSAAERLAIGRGARVVLRLPARGDGAGEPR